MIDLNEYKNLKKLKLMISELTEVNKIIIANIETLKKYRKYIPVNDVLITLTNNKTLIEIHLNKCKRIIQDAKN